MHRRKISEREHKRLMTRRERYGPDFESQNAAYASSFSNTRFNSDTGSRAAKARWKQYREKKMLERAELERVKATQNNEKDQ